MLQNRLFLAPFLVFLSLASPPAHAEMMFCNRTQNPLEAAFGYHEADNWVSEGWWHLDPNHCARVYDKPLTQRFYFYYAISLAPPAPKSSPLQWAGKYELCVDLKAFHIDGDGDCAARNYHKQGFQEIDIGAFTRDYTLDFKDTTESHK